MSPYKRTVSATCTVECRRTVNRTWRYHRGGRTVEGRCSGVLSSPCSGAGVAPARGPRRWSFSLRACVTVARRCRLFLRAMVSKQSHHLTSPFSPASTPWPLLLFLRASRLHSWATCSPSHTPARLAPAAIVAPPMQIITSLPNLCLGTRERSVTHGQRASPANQGQEKTRFRNSINRQSTRECFQKLPGKPIPSRTARPQARPPQGFSPSNGGAGLQFQVDGPFLHPPIRALRNGSGYGMIFRHP